MRQGNKPQSPYSFSAALLALLLGATPYAHGAACCGGGLAAPSLIVGDDKAQISATASYSQIAYDVGTDKIWRKRSTQEDSQTFKLEAAHIFWDRWQAGFSLPVIRRARAQSTSTGLGDVAANLAYEYLPDWDYNPWRPRGLGYVQLFLPTGRPVQEATEAFQLDARGRGFWGVGAGTILTKILLPIDLFVSLDVHRSFSHAYSNSQSRGTLEPGYGGNASLGAGFNWDDWRFGGSLSWTYEDRVDVSGTIRSRGVPQRYASLAGTISYLLPEEWSLSGSYTDQTLLGSPLNSSLGWGFSLMLQKRWLR